MESIKLLARSSLDFFNKQYPDLVPITTSLLTPHAKTTSTGIVPNYTHAQVQPSKSQRRISDDDTTDVNASTDIDISIDPEAALFHSLNEFATLLAKRKAYFADALDELDGEQPVSLERESITNKVFKNTDYENAAIAKYIRTRLLSYLNGGSQNACASFSSPSSSSVRTVLGHWWSLLLRFLDSDTDPVTSRKNTSDPSIHICDTIRPILSTDLVAVILESIERIMSVTMVLPKYPREELDDYVKNLLLTLKFVSTRLVSLARASKRLVGATGNNEQLIYCNNYTCLVRSFLGKLLAFAYVYLPDSCQFSVSLLSAITPRVRVETWIKMGEEEENNNCNMPSIFPWRRQRFTLSRKPSHKPVNGGQRHFNSPENKQNFEVAISYIKNDSVFTSFYWNYWYVTIENLAFSGIPYGNPELNIETLKFIPGAEILIDYTITHFFKNDLYKVNLFLKSNSKFNPQNEIDATSPSLDPSQSQQNDNFTQPLQTRSSSHQQQSNFADRYSNFVNKNLRVIKTWRCLNSLAKAICTSEQQNTVSKTHSLLIRSVLQLHDKVQLRYIRTIPAYNVPMANLIFNRIFPVVVEDCNRLPIDSYIDWETWMIGHVNLLRTLNVNSQIVSIISLFNIWETIPVEYQRKIVESVLLSTSDDLLDNLLFDATTNNLKQILFVKFLVFKVSKLVALHSCSDLAAQILARFIRIEKQLEYLRHRASLKSLSEWENEIRSNIVGDRTLIFNGGKKFVIGKLCHRQQPPGLHTCPPRTHSSRVDRMKSKGKSQNGDSRYSGSGTDNGISTTTTTIVPTKSADILSISGESENLMGNTKRHGNSLVPDMLSDNLDSSWKLDSEWNAKKKMMKRRDAPNGRRRTSSSKARPAASTPGGATGALCFKVVPVCRSGMNLRYWNEQWGCLSDDNLTFEKHSSFDSSHSSSRSSPTRERLDLSLFKRGPPSENECTVNVRPDIKDERINEQKNDTGDSNELSKFAETITEYNLRTRLMDRMRFVRVFNLTMLEYYDYNNMIAEGPLVIDFEIFK